MNILIITATYSPSTNGVAICTALQKKELEKRGHKVWVIAPKHHHQKKEKNVIRLPSIPNPQESDYPIILPVPTPKLLKKIPKRVDIIYFQHPFYIGGIAKILSKYFKCPTVFYYHTQYEIYAQLRSPKIIPPELIEMTTKYSLKKTLNKADYIITGSETFSKHLVKTGIKTPHTIIPITREFKRLSPHLTTKLLKKHSIPLDKRLVLCVTRLTKEKNIITLLNTWKKLKNKDGYHLLIVGEGPDKSKLKKLTHKLNIDKEVTFTGKIDFKYIAAVYFSSCIFAFPSKSEVQPGVIFEAMFAGLPIVAFNCPGPKDFTKAGENSFLAKTNNDFTNYLQELIDSPQKAKLMGIKSKTISKKYKLSHSIDLIEALFSKLKKE